MQAAVRGKSCCLVRGEKPTQRSKFRHDPLSRPASLGSCLSLALRCNRFINVKPSFACNLDARQSGSKQEATCRTVHYNTAAMGRGRASAHTSVLPTSPPVSSAIVVVVGVGVGVGINVQYSCPSSTFRLPCRLSRGRPDREHRHRSPSPSVPRPSRAFVPVPTPTPACLWCQPQFSFQECTGAAGSGSGIEPMIPGAHACAQAFPPYFPSAPGC